MQPCNMTSQMESEQKNIYIYIQSMRQFSYLVDLSQENHSTQKANSLSLSEKKGPIRYSKYVGST